MFFILLSLYLRTKSDNERSGSRQLGFWKKIQKCIIVDIVPVLRIRIRFMIKGFDC